MKLEALKPSYVELEFNAKARLTKFGVDSDQYRSYLQKIEAKKLEIVSINHRMMYKKRMLESDDNPMMNPSEKVAG